MFARVNLVKGQKICEYEGNLCTYKVFKEKEKYYEKMGMGSYILEFKFNDQRWAIDATEENGSFGRLINHSKLNQNIKPVVEVKKGQPTVIFVALRNITRKPVGFMQSCFLCLFPCGYLNNTWCPYGHHMASMWKPCGVL